MSLQLFLKCISRNHNTRESLIGFKEGVTLNDIVKYHTYSYEPLYREINNDNRPSDNRSDFGVFIIKRSKDPIKDENKKYFKNGSFIPTLDLYIDRFIKKGEIAVASDALFALSALFNETYMNIPKYQKKIMKKIVTKKAYELMYSQDYGHEMIVFSYMLFFQMMGIIRSSEKLGLPVRKSKSYKMQIQCGLDKDEMDKYRVLGVIPGPLKKGIRNPTICTNQLATNIDNLLDLIYDNNSITYNSVLDNFSGIKQGSAWRLRKKYERFVDQKKVL